MDFRIQTHASNRHYTGHHFFLLSKGNHAGRPMTAPRPNSFVVQCLDEHDRTELYWICYCLWQSRQFERLLVGSVIPFLRIHEATTVIMKGIAHSGQRREVRIESISAFEKLQSVENNLKQTLKLIARQREILAARYLKP